MPNHYADTTRNPDTMTADERRDEVAGILARGLVRALEAKHTADIGDRENLDNLDEHGETCLELPGDQGLSVAPPSAG